MIAGVSVKQIALRPRPTGRQPQDVCRRTFLIEVVEDLLDDQRVLSALASCVALPPASDRHGWRECIRIVGTILALQSDAGDDLDVTAA